jgi:hypothetical protein
MLDRFDVPDPGHVIVLGTGTIGLRDSKDKRRPLRGPAADCIKPQRHFH